MIPLHHVRNLLLPGLPPLEARVGKPGLETDLQVDPRTNQIDLLWRYNGRAGRQAVATVEELKNGAYKNLFAPKVVKILREVTGDAP